MNNINNKKIPRAVIIRLPKYYRYLQSIIHSKEKISSLELSKYMGVTPVLIRHDLHCLGKYGRCNCGYNVQNLYTRR